VVSRTCTETEIAAAIGSAPRPLRLIGTDAYAAWRTSAGGEPFSLRSYAGIVEHAPADMVVTARAGTLLSELQEALAEKGQCLPLALLEGFPQGTLGGAMAMGLPHLLEGAFGGWRDWVLGLKVVLADGTVAKGGSRAVKNVAGYDVQKLMVGSRGSLAAILEATLRTMPKSAADALPESVRIYSAGGPKCIQRVLPQDFEAVAKAARPNLAAACSATGTLWLAGTPQRRFASDWLMAAEGVKVSLAEPQRALMCRAKAIFDPEGKLNPGEWEVL
jgi:FAD/FMN-containing dehydrogenase